jgi:zinc transport system substrate-binding protein
VSVGPSRRALVVGLVGSLAAAGCGGGSEDGDADSQALDVVASFYPLYEVALRVGGNRVAADNLTPAGAEPHDLELTPDAVDALEDADLILYLGEGFQPAVHEIAERRGNAALDLLAGRPVVEGPSAEDPAEEGPDPHVWLDPTMMADIAEEVADAFAALDPEGAETYRDHADRYEAEILALDREFEEGLADCERRTIVTSHAAFGYLASRYNLRQEAISGISPEAEPDPERLAELADLVEEEGVTVVFTESLVSPEVAETLAREVGVQTAVLNPIEGLSDEQIEGGDSYASIMRENLAALRGALSCV